MLKLFSGLHIAVLTVGLGFVPPFAFAQEDGAKDTGTGSGDNATKEETMLEKLEDAFKESPTPTDEETDPIGTGEDIDRDLY